MANGNLMEGMYPSLSALGTYMSNFPQYSQRMTPYPRDARYDHQRAFGDALQAYMRGVPVRQQMRQQREQIAIDRKRQKEIDDRQRKLFPYQIEQAQRQNRIQKLQLKGEEQKQDIANRWTEIVSASGATPTEKQRLMQLGPSAGFNLLQKITSRVEKRKLTDDEVLSLPSEMQKYENFLQYDGTKIVPTVGADVFKEIIKSGRQGKILTLEQKQKVFPESTDDVLNNLFVAEDSSEASGLKIVQLPISQKPLSAKQQLISRGQTDPEVLASSEYATVFTELYETPQFTDFRDQKTGVVTKKPVYLPIPNSVKLPTSPNWKPTNEHIIALGKQSNVEQTYDRKQPQDIGYEVATEQKLSTSQKSRLQDKKSVSGTVMKFISDLERSLKEFGAQSTGDESAKQEALYGEIDKQIRTLDNMGVPNGPDIILALRKLMNPTTFGLVDKITSPIDTYSRLYKTEFDPTNYIINQLQEMKRQIQIAVKSINHELDTGEPLTLEQLQLMDSTGQFSDKKPVKEFQSLNKSEQKKRIARPPNG